MSDWNRFLKVLPLILLMSVSGCAGIPTATDRTATWSMDMVVDGCVVRTYVSDDGVDASGKDRYSRFGRVFYYPERDALAYNPDFGWVSGAAAFVTFGVVVPGVSNIRAAFLRPTKGGWQMFLADGNRLIPTEVISAKKQLAAERGAVFLQTGKDPGDCIRFE